jgi:hypothetical protein
MFSFWIPQFVRERATKSYTFPSSLANPEIATGGQPNSPDVAWVGERMGSSMPDARLHPSRHLDKRDHQSCLRNQGNLWLG